MNRNLRLAVLNDEPGGGGAPGKWYEALPEEVRGNPSITKYKSLDELARGHINAESLIGKKRIAAPDAAWKDEDWSNFYRELGRPEAPDGYKLPQDLKLPEGVSLSEEKLKKANAALHRAGLTPKQHEAVMRYYGETLGEAHQAESQARAAAEAEGVRILKDAWKDKYDANLDVARSVVRKFGEEGLMDVLVASGAANDPKFIIMLQKIGEQVMEDSARGGGGGGLVVMDSTAALAEIENLKMDVEFQKALNDKHNPGNKAALQRWQELFAKAYPGVQQ